MSANQQLLDAIVSFAEKSQSVNAMILVGSQARAERHADEYSDIDLIMVVDYPERFISSDEWLMDIGKPHISFVEPTFLGEKEKRVLFDNALDVDFVIVSQQHAQDVIGSSEGMGILSRGYRVLINKEDLLMPLLTNPLNQSCLILAENTFTNTVNDFWYHAIWTTKKLLRKELWAAKFCLDNYMKWKLLWVIEQYEHVKHGQSYDTWYGGRFLDSWADPDVKERLGKTFSHYEEADMISALFETMSLFRSLALEVSKAYGFEYPSHADEYSTNWAHEKLTRA